MIMPTKKASIFVVDNMPGDYQEIQQSAAADETEVVFQKTAREALRTSVAEQPELWIINTRLPDMAGVDLSEMLKERNPGVPIYLVTDQYSPEEEMSARCCGATMYLSKPLQSQWLLCGNQSAN